MYTNVLYHWARAYECHEASKPLLYGVLAVSSTESVLILTSLWYSILLTGHTTQAVPDPNISFNCTEGGKEGGRREGGREGREEGRGGREGREGGRGGREEGGRREEGGGRREEGGGRREEGGGRREEGGGRREEGGGRREEGGGRREGGIFGLMIVHIGDATHTASHAKIERGNC